MADKLDAFYKKDNYRLAILAFTKLNEMELLQKDWELWVNEAQGILLSRGPKAFRQLNKAFSDWLDKHMPDWSIIFEQLLVYFLYTYFCGAVYDNQIFGKAAMSVYSIFIIYEMLLAKWVKNEHSLDMEDVVEVCYKYSRELEHSDENLEFLEAAF